MFIDIELSSEITKKMASGRKKTDKCIVLQLH